MITQEYNLNLIPDKVPVSVDCSQYDSLSRTIVFNIYDGTVLKDLTGATATVRGTKSDNTGFEYPCTVNGSQVSFNIQDQMTIFSGRVPCEIRLVDNGILGSCNFMLNVEPTPLDTGVIISETDLPLLEEAEQNAIRAEQAADEAESLLSTVVKSVNNTFPDAQGNVTVQTSSPLSAGTGISIANDVVSNTAPIWHGNEVGDLPVPINADQLQGHPASYFQTAEEVENVGDATIYRCGKLRCIYVRTASADIATLTSRDLPVGDCRIMSKVYNGTTYVDCYVAVYPSGKLVVRDLYGGEVADAQYGFLVTRVLTYFVQ